ncbi:S-layer homology domain-containing protein [Peptoniphilus obesi]|uniref:S-layer homology domain-containing protein n=1 Tax=Peptoniphilus obesi TaxID=1472765 RepID=UPI0004AD9E4F|nr:S-layer homology domain-containing protein [Peptoniphilus obesi]
MIRKNFKKALGVSLCATILLSNSVFAKEFKDVTKNGPYGWSYSYIDELSDKGVIDGYPNGNFEPDRAVSFEETLKLLKGVINAPQDEVNKAVEKYGDDLTKIGVASWSKESVALAIERDIITLDTVKEAKQKGFINPDNPVFPDRNTISVYFARALKLPANGDQSYLRHDDKDKIPASTKGYLASLVKAGIFSSTGSDGKFEGERHIRRSEMAKITKLSYDYSKAEGLNTETKTMTATVILSTNINNQDTIIVESNNKRYQFRVNSSTIYKQGETSLKFSDIKPDQELKITYATLSDKTAEGLAKTIEITNSKVDLIAYVRGVSNGSVTLNYSSNKDVDLSKDSRFTTNKTETFKTDSNSKIYKYGQLIKLSDLYVDDIVEFKADKNNIIKEAQVYPKSTSVSGTITSVSSATSANTREKITIKLSDNKNYTFYGNSNQNDPWFNNSLFKDLKTGQNVTLSLNYKFVTSIGDQKQDNYGKIENASMYVSKRNDGRIGEISFKTNNGRNVYYITDQTIFRTQRFNNLRLSQINERDLVGLTGKISLRGNDVTEFIEVDSSQRFDAIAKVIDTRTLYNFGQREHEYTIEIVNPGRSSSMKKGEEYVFSSNSILNKYDYLRITGYKEYSNIYGNQLTNVQVKIVDGDYGQFY